MPAKFGAFFVVDHDNIGGKINVFLFKIKEKNRFALCQAYFTAFLLRIQVPGKDFVVLVEVLHYTKVRYVEKNCFSGR